MLSLLRFRLTKPLHCELDIGRLQKPPAFHFGLIAVLRIAFEVLLRHLSCSGPFSGEFFSDEWVFGHSGRLSDECYLVTLPLPTGTPARNARHFRSVAPLAAIARLNTGIYPAFQKVEND